MQSKEMQKQSKAMQCKAMQSKAKQCKTTQSNAIQSTLCVLLSSVFVFRVRSICGFKLKVRGFFFPVNMQPEQLPSWMQGLDSLRVGVDGRVYTEAGFRQHYGDHFRGYWEAAPRFCSVAKPVPAQSSVDKPVRIAKDGYAYTEEQFADWYGEDYMSHWMHCQVGTHPTEASSVAKPVESRSETALGEASAGAATDAGPSALPAVTHPTETSSVAKPVESRSETALAEASAGAGTDAGPSALSATHPTDASSVAKPVDDGPVPPPPPDRPPQDKAAPQVKAPPPPPPPPATQIPTKAPPLPPTAPPSAQQQAVSVVQPARAVPPAQRAQIASTKDFQMHILHPLRAAVTGSFPDWTTPLSLRVDGRDVPLARLEDAFEVAWPNVCGHFIPVLESLDVAAWTVHWYPLEPDPTPPKWPDRPRLDVVLTFSDGSWARWHPNSDIIWSTDAMPTAAMKMRQNRRANLIKKLEKARAAGNA